MDFFVRMDLTQKKEIDMYFFPAGLLVLQSKQYVNAAYIILF